ncbi:DUF4283 domain protein [Medicago truncatula]|uniref:DUF4283 domain protein n=1 Tax=Medicago truncatula TaxID=3880 RepID=G7JLZ5_MEDTR|nr:DUF4283 domain protein [Medicago truncatula]KEH29247.1 DUF4283 domain protein [Medicago truncatula]
MENTAGWKMVPLGKGYYDFHFESADDLRRIWAAGTVNLKPVELPQEYWRERILKEIASAVGTPIDIDGPTRNHTFGHYARILVDIDPSKITFDEILVERDGFAFKVELQYERRPLFCHHYFSIGHDVSACRWLRLQPPKDKNDRGKQIVVAEAALPPKPTRQNNNNNDVGAYVGIKLCLTLTLESDSISAIMIFSNSLLVPIMLRNRWHSARNLGIQVISSHIYREGNSCANKLAALGHSMVGEVWLDTLPDELKIDFFRDRCRFT